MHILSHEEEKNCMQSIIWGVELVPKTHLPDNSTYAVDFCLYDICQT